jgi:hypothetical protein
MSRALQRLAKAGRHTAFHASCGSIVLTGMIAIATAGDLGPYAPLLIAIGFYLVIFGALAELLLGARTVIAQLARGVLHRKALSLRRAPFVPVPGLGSEAQR